MSVFKITDIKHPAYADSNIYLYGDGTVSIPSLLLDEHELGDLSDVDTAGEQNESVLAFDAGQGKWRPATVPSLVAGVPTGAISMFGGDTLPTGWLNCDGTAVSRDTYAALFAVVGTAYGSGDGTTTFNLPDLRLRFPRGVGDGYSLGSSTNTNSHDHTVTVADGNHAHTHSVSGPILETLNGNVSGNTDTAPNHTHSTNTNTTGAANTSVAGSHDHDVSTNTSGGGNTGSPSTTVSRTSGNLNAASANHTHSTPNHNHSINESFTGGHSHSTNNHNHTINEGGGGEHSHNFSDSFSVELDTTFTTISEQPSASTHSHTASSNNEEHLPAYLTVRYIIKT